MAEVSSQITLAGDASEAIVSYAERSGCDLIVNPRHGRGGIRALLFGRVAQDVVMQARCPVLTLPGQGR